MPSATVIPTIIRTESELYAGLSIQQDGTAWHGDTLNDNLILSIQGNIAIETGGLQLECPPHSLIFLPAGKSRRFEAVGGNWRALWVHFDLRNCNALQPNWGDKPLCRCLALEGEDWRRIHAAFLQICHVTQRRRILWHSLSYLLLSEIILHGNIAARTSIPSEQLRLATQLLRDLAHPLPIDEIAARCSLSHAAFYRKFQEAFGVSPRRYREQEMLRQTRMILEMCDYTIAEIAARLGCSSGYYLSTCFKRCLGLSPAEYRRRFHRRKSPS